MGKVKTIFAVTALAAAVAAGGSIMAFAEGTTADSDTEYSCAEGQQKHTERHAKFKEMPEFSTDEEREAYFAERGIGRKANPHDENAEETDETADFGHGKGRPRRAGSRYDGKSIEEQLEAGTITQEEADAIKAEAYKKHSKISEEYTEE